MYSTFAYKGNTNNAHLQVIEQKVYFLVKFACKWTAVCDIAKPV